jgi:hypothetical protein
MMSFLVKNRFGKGTPASAGLVCGAGLDQSKGRARMFFRRNQ